MRKSFGWILRYPKKWMAGLTALTFLYSVVASPLAEAGFWEDRHKAAARQDGGVEMAGLPASAVALGDRVLGGYDALSGLSRGADLPSKTVSQKDLPGWMRSLVTPYGDVEDFFLAQRPESARPFIVLLQDVHDHAEAQSNLENILLAYQSRLDLRLVGLEGARGALRAAAYRSLPFQEAFHAAADYLLAAKVITGPEHFSLTAPSLPAFWGVETESSYLANVKAYRDAAALQPATRAYEARLAEALSAAKTAVYNPALMAMDQKAGLYAQEKIGLGEYLESLSAGGADASALPNVRLFLETYRREKTLDFSATEKERALLIQSLVGRLSREEMSSLMSLSADYRLGRLGFGAYYGRLKDLVRKHGLSLDGYPAMKVYIEYALSADRIRKDALFDEIARHETAAGDRLASTPKEKEALSLARDARLLGRLLHQQLTPSEWKSYEARRAAVSSLNERLAVLAPGRPLHFPADLSVYEAFYRQASLRNEHMLSNFLAKFPGLSPSPLVGEGRGEGEPRPALAVLVVGGFHTAGLRDLLTRQGLSHAVVTPHLTRVDKDANYLDVFTRAHTPLEKLFLGEKLFVQRFLATVQTPVDDPRAADAAKVFEEGEQALAKAALAAELPAEQLPQAATQIDQALDAQNLPHAQSVDAAHVWKTGAGVDVPLEDGDHLLLENPDATGHSQSPVNSVPLSDKARLGEYAVNAYKGKKSLIGDAERLARQMVEGLTEGTPAALPKAGTSTGRSTLATEATKEWTKVHPGAAIAGGLVALSLGAAAGGVLAFSGLSIPVMVVKVAAVLSAFYTLGGILAVIGGVRLGSVPLEKRDKTWAVEAASAFGVAWWREWPILVKTWFATIAGVDNSAFRAFLFQDHWNRDVIQEKSRSVALVEMVVVGAWATLYFVSPLANRMTDFILAHPSWIALDFLELAVFIGLIAAGVRRAGVARLLLLRAGALLTVTPGVLAGFLLLHLPANFILFWIPGRPTLSTGRAGAIEADAIASAVDRLNSVKEGIFESVPGQRRSDRERQSVLPAVYDFLSQAERTVRLAGKEAAAGPLPAETQDALLQVLQGIQTVIVFPQLTDPSPRFARQTEDLQQRVTALWLEAGRLQEAGQLRSVLEAVKDVKDIKKRMETAHVVFKGGKARIEDMDTENWNAYSPEIWAPYLTRDTLRGLVVGMGLELDQENALALPRLVGRVDVLKVIAEATNAMLEKNRDIQDPLSRLMGYVDMEKEVRNEPEKALKLAEKMGVKVDTLEDFVGFMNDVQRALTLLKWRENWESKGVELLRDRGYLIREIRDQLGLSSMPLETAALRLLNLNIPFDVLSKAADGEITPGDTALAEALMEKGMVREMSMAGGSASRWKDSLKALIEKGFVKSTDVPENLPRALAAVWDRRTGENGVDLAINGLIALRRRDRNVGLSYVLSPYTWVDFMRATWDALEREHSHLPVSAIAQNSGEALVVKDGRVTDERVPGKVLGHGNVRGWMSGILQALQDGTVYEITHSADGPLARAGAVQIKEIISRMAEEGMVHAAVGNWRSIGQQGGGFADANGVPNVYDTAIPAKQNGRGFAANRDINLFATFIQVYNYAMVLYALSEGVSVKGSPLITWKQALAISKGDERELGGLQERISNLTPAQQRELTDRFLDLLPSEYVEKKDEQKRPIIQWEKMSGEFHGTLAAAIRARMEREGVRGKKALIMAYADMSLSDFRLLGADAANLDRVPLMAEVKSAVDVLSPETVEKSLDVLRDQGVLSGSKAPAGRMSLIPVEWLEKLGLSEAQIEFYEKKVAPLWESPLLTVLNVLGIVAGARSFMTFEQIQAYITHHPAESVFIFWAALGVSGWIGALLFKSAHGERKTVGSMPLEFHVIGMGAAFVSMAVQGPILGDMLIPLPFKTFLSYAGIIVLAYAIFHTMLHLQHNHSVPSKLRLSLLSLPAKERKTPPLISKEEVVRLLTLFPLERATDSIAPRGQADAVRAAADADRWMSLVNDGGLRALRGEGTLSEDLLKSHPFLAGPEIQDALRRLARLEAEDPDGFDRSFGNNMLALLSLGQQAARSGAWGEGDVRDLQVFIALWRHLLAQSGQDDASQAENIRVMADAARPRPEDALAMDRLPAALSAGDKVLVVDAEVPGGLNDRARALLAQRWAQVIRENGLLQLSSQLPAEEEKETLKALLPLVEARLAGETPGVYGAESLRRLRERVTTRVDGALLEPLDAYKATLAAYPMLEGKVRMLFEGSHWDRASELPEELKQIFFYEILDFLKGVAIEMPPVTEGQMNAVRATDLSA